MPFYHRLGKIPPQRHTVFYKDDGRSLYREELFSTRGFSGIYSNKYHIHMPTQVLKIKELQFENSPLWTDAPLQHYHFFTEKSKSKGNFVTARRVYLTNRYCSISTAHVTEDDGDMFYRNAGAHEYIFIHHGRGKFTSEYGHFPFQPGDQLIVPRGTTFQLLFDDFKNNKLLVVESTTPFDIPKHYRNEYGQILESAPYCERDLKIPEGLESRDKSGEFKLWLKNGERIFEHLLPHHPYDVIGWDGFHYPFALNIKDYCPKVGKLHLPPPTHLCFDTAHFVLCNFVPRPFDFHPKAVPVPYFHSNIDSDEIIYYAEGNFMSRTGVQEGSVTLHPGGIPHGPQPGKIEASLGAKETNEYAVMVDTFEPLQLTTYVKDSLDENYPHSWLTKSSEFSGTDGKDIGTTTG
ncbi:MAG: homogentisate 1,2-dioxygenase [candidate division Zixibacteria bacterium]|nr:homogentisate 1,2-dioxygenase [candidate division Zixibacteria bacterium]